MQPTNSHLTDNDPQVVVGGGQVISPQQGFVQDVQPAAVPAPASQLQGTNQSQPLNLKGQFMGKGGVVKGIFVAALVLVVFVAGFAANSGVVALNSSNARSAGNAMVAALVAGNANKAYGLASANLRDQQTADALLQSVGNVQTSKPDVTDQNVQINGNTAVYVANVNNLPADNSGSTSGVFVVSLVKHGVNSWKVDDVSVQ